MPPPGFPTTICGRRAYIRTTRPANSKREPDGSLSCFRASRRCVVAGFGVSPNPAPAQTPRPPRPQTFRRSDALTPSDQIASWLDAILADDDFAHAFPVETKVHEHGRVEVYLDSDTGIDLATCQRVSRALEAHLDETGLLGEKYTLEVSSPGSKHPMRLPRQFPKHVGRTLDVTLADGSEVSGELKEVTDAAIVLEEEVVTRNEKNKRVKQLVRHELPFDDIQGALVRFSFK